MTTHDNGAYGKSENVSGPDGCWHRDGFGYCAECKQAQRLLELMDATAQAAKVAERARIMGGLERMGGADRVWRSEVVGLVRGDFS